MASSSSSFVRVAGWTYDVFISFRGEDTRNNFVDHLFTTLVQKGIRVFNDNEMLRRGKPISSELLKAIEESKFSVVVFSKNYANSSWCLDELVKIMECQDQMGHKVLPVFYHVDPSHVRGQKRDFTMAFREHEERFKENQMDKVNKWRKALAAAGNLSGWHISPSNGGESLFINKIVQEICFNVLPRHIENNLIGIESRISKLISLLGIEETHEVRMVGIYGMGGIGKTTIARALFRRISNKFNGCSFVNDVRENGFDQRNICRLQERILKDITDHECNIRDPNEGARMIQTRFCEKKVLLVLDDVDDVKQLEFLAATHEWFGVGSRIIITTRDEHLLSDANAKYKPAILLKEQAVELFNRHAFRNNCPPNGYEELSNRAVRYTGHLPLALKVLGSFFHGRKADVWESALNRLEKTSNTEIFETLKISFDGLEVSEQKIFLDIVCFFKGHSQEYVTSVLDTFGFDQVIGISVLIEKSLITFSKKQLDMHDLVREMGLKIVREDYPNSRLWVCEEIHDFIKKNMKLEEIEAIMATFNYAYDVDESDPPRNAVFAGVYGFSADIFKNMKNLRLLKTQGKFTSFEPTFVPVELRWFYWSQYPFSSLSVANMCKLVWFEMLAGKIEHLWKGKKAMPYLKFIHLKELHCLERFPDVSGAPNIERISLEHCRNLVEVHKSLGYLRKLAYLEISYCFNLKCLPSMIEMKLLETLKLSNCSRLEKFPDVSSGMEKLSSIYLTRCLNLEIIPSSIGRLKNLKLLHLDGCDGLKFLPKELGSIEKLEEVSLGTSYPTFAQCKMESINYHTLAKLCCLRKLDLSWRQIELDDFLNNLDAFSSLEELDLSGNDKLTCLPTTISHLSRLKHLKLNECQQLRNIQGLPSRIQVLEATYCPRLEKIEDLTKKHVFLHKIFLMVCGRLQEHQKNEIYLNKMLQQSFLKRCISGDHQLSIWIPGNKIPSWFEEQHHGREIILELPQKWHTTILGFTICAVYEGERFGSNGSISMIYIPFNVFYQEIHNGFERDDWSFSDEGGCSIIMDVRSTSKVIRCGAHILYKEDMESIQQIKTCISDDSDKNSSVSCHNAFWYKVCFEAKSIGV